LNGDRSGRWQLIRGCIGRGEKVDPLAALELAARTNQAFWDLDPML
jgi:hypothetical protein